MLKPMGIAWEGAGRLTLAGGMQILRFENVLSSQERINQTFDACFVPRRVHTTGALDAHDMADLSWVISCGARAIGNDHYGSILRI